MFRFGIVTRDQLLRPRKPSDLAPAYAFPLVAAFSAPLTDEEDKALTEIYRALPGGRAVKLTWRGRLRALDGPLLPEIEQRFPPDVPLRVHDMAASNAITSIDLFERLASREKLSFLATDRYDSLQVVSVPGSRWRVVFDADDSPIQFVGRRMVLEATRRERRRFPVNRAVQRYLVARLLPKARTLLAERKAERLALFHPRSLAFAQRDKRFVLGRDDVFSPRPGPFDLVRVISLLSSTRFSSDEVRRALAAVTRTVAENGILALGKTAAMTEDLNATIFVKENGRLRPIAEIAAGYEFRDLVLDPRI